MIPVLYEKDEIAFVSNGLGRLRDCISCVVTEERNGIYECDFEYPMDGANFDLIQCGRIIGVTHDDTKQIQPFDIVSYSKPIDGIVTFHCTHISYRQSGLVVSGTNINSLSDAFTLFGTATPSNPFVYTTDMTSTAYMAAADGVPRSVRQLLGGIEGSVLDSYGGEYEWNKWNVILHSARGQYRDFAIRYGVNMLDFNDESDYLSTYNSCVPYWIGQDNDGNQVVVKGSRVDSGLLSYRNDTICVPLDLTEKFEDKPTTAQLEAMALQYMTSNTTNLPRQTITVDFIRLQDFEEYKDYANLLQCNLCDSITVIFPNYQTSAIFKIVKTEWDVLEGRYNSMELGHLSTTLAEALGITNTPDNINSINNFTVTGDLTVGGDVSIASNPLDDFVIEDSTETGTCSGISTDTITWTYRKWASGKVEMWTMKGISTNVNQSDGGGYRTGTLAISIPSGLLPGAPLVFCNIRNAYTTSAILSTIGLTSPSATSTGEWAGYRITSVSTSAYKYFQFYVVYTG